MEISKIYKPGYQGGSVEILGAKEVCEKWNIKDVHQVIDILGLMGDAVDNIPGIPGVGEKRLPNCSPNMARSKMCWKMPINKRCAR